MYETITGCVAFDFLEFELSGVSAIEGSRIINCWKERPNWAIALGKQKVLESSLKKSLGEIEDEMNEDFCNVKTLKDNEKVLRFWEHTLKQCKRRKTGDDDRSGGRMWQGLMCL